jgi:hypothetical protein
MEKFPTLELIVRYGKVGPIGLAVLVALGVLAWSWPGLGVIALVPALVLGGIALLVARSYVELVLLITDMLLPR